MASSSVEILSSWPLTAAAAAGVGGCGGWVGDRSVAATVATGAAAGTPRAPGVRRQPDGQGRGRGLHAAPAPPSCPRQPPPTHHHSSPPSPPPQELRLFEATNTCWAQARVWLVLSHPESGTALLAGWKGSPLTRQVDLRGAVLHDEAGDEGGVNHRLQLDVLAARQLLQLLGDQELLLLLQLHRGAQHLRPQKKGRGGGRTSLTTEQGSTWRQGMKGKGGRGPRSPATSQLAACWAPPEERSRQASGRLPQLPCLQALCAGHSQRRAPLVPTERAIHLDGRPVSRRTPPLTATWVSVS